MTKRTSKKTAKKSKSRAIVRKSNGKGLLGQTQTLKRVLVNFVLDKSGSMMDVVQETRQGFNNYLQELKKQTGIEYLFSLTLFDTQFHVVGTAQPLTSVRDLDTNNYQPDGYTALYDAIGVSVKKVEDRLAANAPRPEKVLTVILTDGHENSSREWTKEAIRQLIQRKEAEGNWTFVFLGATFDAMDIGAGLGVQLGNVSQYSPAATPGTFAAVARNTVTYSNSPGTATASFFQNPVPKGATSK